MKNPKVIAIAGGFYFFGNEVQTNEGFVALDNAAMFGGFGGGKGVPGVCRGDAASTVTLDRFREGDTLTFPMSSVYAVMPCVDLYKFKGTTLR